MGIFVYMSTAAASISSDRIAALSMIRSASGLGGDARRKTLKYADALGIPKGLQVAAYRGASDQELLDMEAQHSATRAALVAYVRA